MAALGSFALLVALALAAAALVAGIAAQWLQATRQAPRISPTRLEAIARSSGMLSFAATSLAALALLEAVFANNFSIAYVAEHSNRTLAIPYKFAALWAGQEGSLLLWAWLLGAYSFLLRWRFAGRARLYALASALLAGVEFFFLLLLNFVATPFSLLTGQIPDDGNGLNPLLQYPEMVIHPPLLYLGYVGFAVPFALALAALMLRLNGTEWLKPLRTWTLVAWLFLTCGIFLGMHWAYAVLGWGGYWGWDPVENASLMPWLTGTAYLHSVMMEQKRGMMKGWNLWLIFSTFLLTILGTLLTRGGLVSSVHAFAHSSIATWFITFLLIVIAVCLFTAILHSRQLKGSEQVESLVSREASFLFNNLILLTACMVILWGTLFPVLSESFTGSKITVGPAFYNGVAVPIGLFLLFLTGVGPLLPWRSTNFRAIRRKFLLPVIMLWSTLLLLFFGGLNPWRSGEFDRGIFYALIALALGSGVMTAMGGEFAAGLKAERQQQGTSWITSFLSMLVKHHRRYGGYTVHLGVVVVMTGLAGAAFNLTQEIEVKQGTSFQLGPYKITCTEFTQDSTPNYDTEFAMLDVSGSGNTSFQLSPERRVYLASQQPQTMVAIHSTPLWDLYAVCEGTDPDTNQPVIKVFLNPLVSWIWIGLGIMVAGTLLALGGGIFKPATPLHDPKEAA